MPKSVKSIESFAFKDSIHSFPEFTFLLCTGQMDLEEQKKTMGLLWEIRASGVRPTIVVPCSSQALVNILNIRTLLEEGRWTKPNLDDWRSRKKEIRMKKVIHDEEFEFRIVDSTAKFEQIFWFQVIKSPHVWTQSI